MQIYNSSNFLILAPLPPLPPPKRSVKPPTHRGREEKSPSLLCVNLFPAFQEKISHEASVILTLN